VPLPILLSLLNVILLAGCFSQHGKEVKKMKKWIAVLFAAIILVSLVGCSNTGTAAFKAMKSSDKRITVPNVPGADLTALVSGNSNFAFKLYHQLNTNDATNMFYSPYSISSALAMTWAGAKGDTAGQMASALEFQLPQAQLHPAFNQLSIDLASRGQNAKGVNGKSFSLNIANALWGQSDFTIQPAFLKLLAQNYGAGMNLLDFAKAPETARGTINKWVSDQTNQLIRELLAPGTIDTNTRLVLTNTIYFNAAWQSPFAKEKTNSGTFNLLSGNTVSVPLMSNRTNYSYVKGGSFQAVELPYSGNEIAMDIIMPDTGSFAAFESEMNADKIAGIISQLKAGEIILTMPKFKFDSSFSLKDNLTAMGMTDAFTDNADFSGITGKPDLKIKDVVHKAFVSVDEAGTEAAAASGVIMEPTSMPPSITIDHPFIFLIRDIQTGTILFIGRVMNPGL
jgi:serpin B